MFTCSKITSAPKSWRAHVMRNYCYGRLAMPIMRPPGGRATTCRAMASRWMRLAHAEEIDYVIFTHVNRLNDRIKRTR